MNQELSKKMIDAIGHMKRNGNKLVRFPGGYWAREGWHSWNGPCWGTPTVEAIVRRGYAEYTVWKDGRSGRFPIECGLTPRAADVCQGCGQVFENPDTPYCHLCGTRR